MKVVPYNSIAAIAVGVDHDLPSYRAEIAVLQTDVDLQPSFDCNELLVGGIRQRAVKANNHKRGDIQLSGTRRRDTRGVCPWVLFGLSGLDGQRKAIASKYRFVAFNLRYHGTGPSSDDGPKYSIATHVDDVAAFIQGLNSGPVNLVGWSYSGPIVMLVTLQHPELVRSIAVYEPTAGGFITDPELLKSAGQDRQAMLSPAIAASKSGDLANVARLVPAGVNNQPDIFDQLAPEARSMFLDNARTVALLVASPPPPPLSCDQLRQIKIPTLLSRGEDTRTVFRLATDGAAACMANAKVVVLPGGRHLSMVQQPDAFNAILMQFLSTVGSQVKN